MRPDRALVVLPVAYLLLFASGGLQLPLTSVAMANVGLSMSDVGLMWAARAGLAVFAPLLWGTFADRVGDARPFAIGSALAGALLLLALTTTTTVLGAVALFGLYGIAASPSGSTLDGMTLTALRDDTRRFGKVRAWGTLGFGATALGGALLVEHGSLSLHPSVVFTACAVPLVAAALALGFCPRLERPRLERSRDALDTLLRRDVVSIFLVCGLLWSSHIAYSSFLAPLLTAAGLPMWCVGASFASAILVEVIAFARSHVLLARFGARRTLIAVALVTVARWLLAAWARNPWLVVALHGLHGVTFGVMYATLVQLLSERVPERMRQTAQSMLGSSALGVGGALGAGVAGAVADRFGPTPTWLAMAALASLGAAAAVWGARAAPVPSR